MRRLSAAFLFAASAFAFALLPVPELGAVQKKKGKAAPPSGGPSLATPFSFGAKSPLTLPDGALGVWASAGTVEGTKLVVPADATAGVQWLRVATPGGVSAARPACVDPYPELAADPANTDRNKAQAVPVPCVIAGKLDPETRAFYRIPVQKGKPLTVECLARRLGSPFDPVVVLYHPDGRTVPGAYADDTPGLMGDCRVRWTPPADGAVLAEVRDSTYKGGSEYSYRLRVGDAAGATTAFPLVLQRGQTATVGFAGPDVAQSKPVTVVLPLDPALDAVPVAPAGGWPVWLKLSDHPQTVEAEPNDTPATATRIGTPGGVSARLLVADDKDYFRFTVAKGQKYAVTVQTHELNSPAEVLLRVLDSANKEVGQSDPTVPTCQVQFTAAADGEMVAACEHQNYLHGPTEVYHLAVRPVTPDFAVSLASDRLSLPAGGVGIVTGVKLDRTDFNGPVTLSVVGDGLSGSGLAGTTLGVSCSADARPGIRTMRIKATGIVNGVELVRWASVAEPVRAALNGIPTVPPELTHTAAVAVLPAGPFTLAAKSDKLTVATGNTLKLAVTIARREGFNEPVTFSLQAPPAGVSAKPATIAKGESAVTFELTIAGDAAAGPVAVVVKGNAGNSEAIALPVFLTIAKPDKGKK